MKNYYIFDFFIIIILCINEMKSDALCGIRFKSRIVGGSDTLVNNWPWTVSIQFNNKHICAGTLIDNYHVLTAAHCFVFNSISAYKLIFGANNITNLNLNTTRRYISKLSKHELFKNDQTYDIAILKLDKPIDFNINILPACLPSATDNFEGKKCYFNGWGLTYSNGNVQQTLREIQLNVMNKSECQNYVFSFIDQKYCTGQPNVAQDTCQGDSGGGMMCQKEDKKFYVSGIVSYGIGDCGNVGVNAKVDYFIDWIKDIIN